MEDERTKICDMDLENEHKAMLSFMINPRTIAQVAAKFERSYTHVYQKLSIWEAKDWVKKHKSMSGKTIWVLNKKTMSVE